MIDVPPLERIAAGCAFLAATAAAYRAFVPRAFRAAFLSIASVLFAAALSWRAALFVAADVVVVHLFVARVERDRPRSGALAAAVVAWLVLSLVFFKMAGTYWLGGVGAIRAASAPESAALALLPLGFSYAVFRMIHATVDVAKGRLAAGTLPEFGSYVLFFPTWLAGPVERYGVFRDQLARGGGPVAGDAMAGVARFVVGAFKKVVLADSLPAWYAAALAAPDEHAAPRVLLAICGLALRVYLDFSGYTDMALGAARLFGFRIVENFDSPFLKPNLARFWRAWHASVYTFIRDYFFYPLFARKPTRLKTHAGTVVTMVVFMLWHAPNWSFLLLGLYFGFGLVAWHLFQQAQARMPRLRAAMESRPLTLLSTLTTFLFVAVGFLTFEHAPREIATIVARVATPGAW